MRAVSHRDDESGMALITVFMVLMLASALMVGFFATIVADQKSNGIDRDQTQAYAAAHAGLEKLTSNMAALFVTDYSPSKAQIDAIMSKPPLIAGFAYTAPGGTVGSGYSVTYKAETNPLSPNFGNPVPDLAAGTTITSGPYAGFKGIITRYPITITARSTGGAEVRLRRELQTVAVPVFQFGVFSEGDLTFYAGQNFNFGGRVQTNGNLFLSQAAATTMTLADRVTAYKQVVRNNLSNGLDVTTVTFTGAVDVINTTAGAVRPLAINEGSVTGMPSSPGPPAFTQTLNPNWTTISQGTYKSLLRNGLTGAKYLSLPLVTQGAVPIDLIRRPPPPIPPVVLKEDLANPLVYGQRYFAQASLRILLSDTAAELSSLPTVTADVPVNLDWGVALPGVGTPAWYTVDAGHAPMATSPGLSTQAGIYQMTTAAGSTAVQVAINAALPTYFKVPATITVGANLAVTCGGRTATTFIKCNGFTSAIAAGAIVDVTGNVASGANAAFPVLTRTTAAQAAIVFPATPADRTITVTSTAAFAPGVFWLSGSDGGAFTCSGYDNIVVPRILTGCTGLPATLLPIGTLIHTGALEQAGVALNRGFIKIEVQNNASPPVWTDVTQEILKLGFSGVANNGPAGQCDPTPNAVIRLQHVRDNISGVAPLLNGVAGCPAAGNNSTNSNDYWPNVLYDTREGNMRETTRDQTDRTLTFGGMMNYVSLDVGNLTRWLAGAVAPYNAAGMSGTTANNQNGAGFIVYFSDRRGNKCGAPANPSCPAAAVGVETGEYGVEDNVNPLAAAPYAPNGVLDVGEDVNVLTPVPPAVVAIDPLTSVAYVPVLDMYGQTPRNPILAPAGTPLGIAARPWTVTINQWTGMMNRPIFFRRALKLINASNPNAATSNLPTPGLTVAAENPVYVQGNYNATAANPPVPAETHRGAAIIADAVTLLSTAFNDALSFQWPNDMTLRPAVTTSYRFALVSGKGLSFPFPPTTPATLSGYILFGTDGGVGNFLRLLEDWAPVVPGAQTIIYRGSIVSLFTSRQATGTYKCCERVYQYTQRNYVFDNDFLLPSLLPPGTPMFRDVNTLTFRQLLRPNQ